MRYAYYLGCWIPARLDQYDLSTRVVAKKLGIELVDLEGAGCCGTVLVRSVNFKTNIVMSTRILALAKNMGLDLLTLCNGCYESLMEAEYLVKTNKDLREQVNTILKSTDNLVYEGGVKIKHLIEVLYNDIGLDRLRDEIKRPLDGLRVAVHYGCHILRPSNRLKFDNAENPRILDDLVEITGAKSIYWPLKLWCCGSPILAVDENLSLSIAGMKLKSAKEAGADCIVTICPSCQIQFDTFQPDISKVTGEQYNMPVLLYPQLLGLALGFTPKEVGLHLNEISAERLVKALK
ncbi:MAG: CoB--CoM heterodisulfide reductase iron-sulfur subunit B family protein [archaeon GB-1867-035]|nr:CoB--CoM heterodisulfide reductase iron-sulfur subunit B family protein [Candidatus Culexmicrobium profundum]